MEAVKKLQNATKLLQKVTVGSGEGLGSARETRDSASSLANVWIIRGFEGRTGGEGTVPLLSHTFLSSHIHFRTTCVSSETWLCTLPTASGAAQTGEVWLHYTGERGGAADRQRDERGSAQWDVGC